MPYSDLRSYLDALNANGQLLSITEKVKAEPDLSAAAVAGLRMSDRSPALLFDNIEGSTDARVALNTIGSWANLATALEVDIKTPVRDMFFEWVRRAENFPIAVERRDNPPWAENSVEGDDINLFDILPLFRLNAADGGFFLDNGAVVSRDPDDPDNFGKQNVGCYRMQVKGPRKINIFTVPVHDAAIHLGKAEARGEDLPICITLGNDPIIKIMAGTPFAYDQSEYEMAGAIRQAPFPVATAPLIGFDVPWGSEVVIEGVLEAGKREFEGPFGEFTGHYSGGRKLPVMRIDKVSYRTNPIFEHLYIGMPWTELDYVAGLTTCIPIYKQMKAEFPEVQAVNAMYSNGLIFIISTKRRYGGFAKDIGLRALTTPRGLGMGKIVIVVDEGVDPFDLQQVMWAVSTKFNPAGDFVRIPNLCVQDLDPASQPAGITDKIIIDATTPVSPDLRATSTLRSPIRRRPRTGPPNSLRCGPETEL